VKTFQLLRRILHNISSISKALSLQCRFSWRNGYKSAGCRSGYYGVYFGVTLLFDKKSFIKTNRCAGAFSSRRNQLLVLHFSGRFLLTTLPRRQRMLMCISSFTVAIPILYTREFREVLEGTTY